MVIQIRHRRLGAFDSHTFKTDSVIHGLHLYGGPKGSGAEVGGVQMPSIIETLVTTKVNPI